MSRQVRLRRAAITTSILKAIACAAVGGWSMWQTTLPMDSLVAMFAFFVGTVAFVGSAGYLVGAFLLSRRSHFWRIFGGIVDTTLTAVAAWVLFWLAGRSFDAVNGYGPGNPGPLPAVIFAAIGVVWIGASIPMLAWFVLDVGARVERRRQQA